MKRVVLLLMMLAAVAARAQVASSQHDVYDNHDRLAVRIVYTYTDSGIVDTRTLKQYDKQGRVTREETYTADEYLIFVQDHKYDRQGRLVRTTQTSYDDNGEKSVSKLEYRYTSDGKKTVLLDGKQL